MNMLKTNGKTSIKACDIKNESLKIIGLFSQGIYLANKAGSIYMLHDSKYGIIPFGIGINNYSELINKAYIKEDDLVSINDSFIQFTRNNECILHIELNYIDYIYIKPNNKINNKLFIEIAKNKLLNSEKGIFSNLINNKESNNIYTKKVKKYFENEYLNENNYIDFLNEMIGLGPGLTPSGDDFISGYLYTKLNLDNYNHVLVNNMIDYIKTNDKKLTNTISCLYLENVINNKNFSLYDDVLFSKDINELNENIDELLNVGSNSGADILSGMIYAKIY